MVDRLISVGDDLTLPPSVKATDANLPVRLGEAALSATIDETIDEATAGGADVLRVNPLTLPKWAKARALAQLGQSPARVLCVGDSTTAGVYSDSYTTAPGTVNQGGPNSYPAQLARLLTGSGMPASYSLAIPGRNDNDDSRWNAPSGGWIYPLSATGVRVGAGGAAGYTNNGSGLPLVITPGLVADRYKVYYFGDSGTGSITATATGGSAVTFSTAQATGRIYESAVISAAAASTSNTLTVTATGTVFIVGVEWWSSADPNRVRVMNAGVGQSRAEHWAVAQGVNTYGALSTIRALKPDLTIISLGINDGTVDNTTANVVSWVQTIITAAKESGDVLLSAAIPPSIAWDTTAYNAAYKALGLPYVDLEGRYGLSLYDLGLMTADRIHPNALGYGDVARVFARALLA